MWRAVNAVVNFVLTAAAVFIAVVAVGAVVTANYAAAGTCALMFVALLILIAI